MARNVEIKVRLSDPDAMLKVITAITDMSEDIWQEDTYFYCINGRLKLRQVGHNNEVGELIFYQRENSPEPRTSHYFRSAVANARQMLDLLSASLGVAGQVCKHRQVFKIGNSRIHVDEVAGLAGGFLEIEVVLDEDDSLKSGYAKMDQLVAQLDIDANELVANSYFDLLDAETSVSREAPAK